MFSNFSVNSLLIISVSLAGDELLPVDDTYLESIGDEFLISGPGGNITKEDSERLQANACLWPLLRDITRRQQCRRGRYRGKRRHDAHRFVQSIIHETRLLLRESSEGLQIPDSRSFRKRFDAVDDLVAEPAPFRKYSLIRDDGKFAERHQKKFLEFGYRTRAGVGRVRVRRFAEGGEVVPHQAAN
jgi:hypothetical protein